MMSHITYFIVLARNVYFMARMPLNKLSKDTKLRSLIFDQLSLGNDGWLRF